MPVGRWCADVFGQRRGQRFGNRRYVATVPTATGLHAVRRLRCPAQRRLLQLRGHRVFLVQFAVVGRRQRRRRSRANGESRSLRVDSIGGYRLGYTMSGVDYLWLAAYGVGQLG